ncbi:MAG: hypothetical protein ACLFVE_10295 [Chitinispirillaceae bacterium]
MEANNREEKALDALIAHTLKECEVTDAQIEKDAEEYISKEIKLPAEYRKAIRKLKDQFPKGAYLHSEPAPECMVQEEYEESYMAMHRDNKEEELDEETKEEIRKRRQKFIEEERKKRPDGDEN